MTDFMVDETMERKKTLRECRLEEVLRDCIKQLEFYKNMGPRGTKGSTVAIINTAKNLLGE